MKKILKTTIGASIALSSLILIGCGNGSNNANGYNNGNYSGIAVKTAKRSENYLTANDDFSLYRFAKDVKDANTSNCNGGCAQVWPPYYAGVLTAYDKQNGLSNFTRKDGTMQTAYFGYPLYKYSGDANVQDTNGNFVHNEWNLIYPKKFDPNGTGVKLSLSKTTEKYLVAGNGKSLYVFADDNVTNETTCYNVPGGVQCAKVWPPFYANITKDTISQDLDVASFGVVQRTDGKKQISYKGKPLYYFAGIPSKNIAGDSYAGDTNGDWFKAGDWHLVQVK